MPEINPIVSSCYNQISLSTQEPLCVNSSTCNHVVLVYKVECDNHDNDPLLSILILFRNKGFIENMLG